MVANRIARNFHEKFEKLFIHNVRLRGPKATIYCFGLSASRYIEYKSVLNFLSSELNRDDVILELGCGHSLLPTLWEKSNLRVIAIDINQNALKWQKMKSSQIATKSLEAILADGKNLPFREDAISAVSCISVIEHVPKDGDIQVAYEMGRILKPNGLCVISFSLSPHEESYFKKDGASGIPPLLERLPSVLLQSTFKKLDVDRTRYYSERLYSLSDVQKRIITPTG